MELVALYDDHADRGYPNKQQLMEDLTVVGTMARWLQGHGRTRVAFDLVFKRRVSSDDNVTLAR